MLNSGLNSLADLVRVGLDTRSDEREADYIIRERTRKGLCSISEENV